MRCNLIRRRTGSCFAARNLLRCETIKFTARFGVAAESALRRICFAGKVLRLPIKFKMKARLNFKCIAKFKASARLNFRRHGWILKFADKILRREISFRKISAAIMSRLWVRIRECPKLHKANFGELNFTAAIFKIYATKFYRLARAAVRRQFFACLNFALQNLARKLSDAARRRILLRQI